MTGAEAIEAFKIYFDRITSYSAPGYLDGEILLFLNNAQDQFIKDKTFGKDFQPPAFEDNQKRVVDILPLITRDNISSGSISANTLYGANSYQILKSAVSRLLYTIEVEVRVTRTNPTISSEFLKCVPIKTEYIGKVTPNAVNRTHFINPKLVETDDVYIVIGDYYTSNIDNARVSHVRMPYPITVGMADYNGSYSSGYMNLNISIHQEIVDIAVKQAYQAISDPRFQTKVIEDQIKTN